MAFYMLHDQKFTAMSLLNTAAWLRLPCTHQYILYSPSKGKSWEVLSSQLESMQLYQQWLSALYTVSKLTFFPLVISLSFIFTSVICWTIWLCLRIVLDSIIAFLIRFLLLFSSVCWLLTMTYSLTLQETQVIISVSTAADSRRCTFPSAIEIPF